MNIINSLKKIFFRKNDSKIDSHNINENETNMKGDKLLLENFYINYYKHIFKSNYKKKKEKFENRIKFNKPKNSEKNDTNFFYILKGAVYIIEDWWKKNLVKKEKNKRILQRNFNNKNFKIFCTTTNLSTNNTSSKLNNYIQNKNIIKNIKTAKASNKNNFNEIFGSNRNCNKNHIYRNNNKEKGYEYKSIKTVNLPKNESIFQEQNTLEETLINSDSCYFDFSPNNNNIKNPENKFNIYNKINKNIIIKENSETTRENKIIYPIKEIDNLIKIDLNKNFEKNQVKTKINNMILNGKLDGDKITIPWDEQNKNNKTPIHSIIQNYELFQEIKSKIKFDNDMVSLMQNKNLLKENPFDESSIYINNSYLKQDELIRNVNVHIIPYEINTIKLKKNFNNSNNSNTIRNEEENSSFFSYVDKNEDLGENVKSNKMNENYYNLCKIREENNIIYKKPSKKKFENIYKN